MQYTLVLAAIFGAATAIKQSELSSQDASMVMDAINNGELEAMADQWWENNAMPVIDEQMHAFSEQIVENQEAEYGVLLETCDLGMECRATNTQTTTTSIVNEWESVYDQFITSVADAVLRTQKQIEIAYINAQECQINNEDNCKPDVCISLEIEYNNTVTQMTEIEKQIDILMTKWNTLEETRLELVEECPEYLVVEN